MKTLSIYDSRANQLIAVLAMHGPEFTVLEGDPDILPKFGLHRFQDLQQMEQHINGNMSLLHAVPDENEDDTVEKADLPQEQPQEESTEGAMPEATSETIPTDAKPEVPTEQVDSRLKPAIDIIKQLLARAEEKQKKRAEGETQVQQAQLESQNAKVQQEQPYQAYVSVDGDNIGNKVFQAEEQDDEEAIMEISNKINQGQDLLREWAQQNGGKVVEAGGDEGLLKVPSTALDKLEELRQQYQKLVDATLTVGVGKKISESTKARQLGKLRGKNQVVMFDEGTEQELQVRMEQQDIDCKEKLKTLTQSGAQPQGQPQEQMPEGEPTPKFAPPEGRQEQGQKDQAEYDKWIKDGMPEEQEEEVEEKKPNLLGSPKHRSKKKKEHRMAKEYAKSSGDDPEFLKNVLSSVRGK